MGRSPCGAVPQNQPRTGHSLFGVVPIGNCSTSALFKHRSRQKKFIHSCNGNNGFTQHNALSRNARLRNTQNQDASNAHRFRPSSRASSDVLFDQQLARQHATHAVQRLSGHDSDTDQGPAQARRHHQQVGSARIRPCSRPMAGSKASQPCPPSRDGQALGSVHQDFRQVPAHGAPSWRPPRSSRLWGQAGAHGKTTANASCLTCESEGSGAASSAAGGPC